MPGKDMIKYSCDKNPKDLSVEYIGNWIENML